MIRCKACGYIMKEGKLGDRCPACGAPKTAFEAYTDPMAAPRRRILNWQLHPIGVHFPTVLSVAVLVFSVAVSFFSGDARRMLVDTAKILTIFLPLVVFAAFWLGWIDGKIRFRKIRNSHILKTKIVYAITLFVVTTVLAVVVWAGDFGSAWATIGSILLGGAAVVLVFLLGILGTSIIGAAFPGK